TSRRRVLKGMAMAAVGGLVAAFTSREAPVASAAPACNPLGENCRDVGQLSNCCGPQTTTHLVCTQVAQTGAKRCECQQNFTSCGGNCVANCTGGQALNTTTCRCACPSGTTLCGGSCVADCTGGQTLNTTTCTCAC